MTTPFKPGLYQIATDLTFLEIRASRSSTVPSVGKYFKNDTFSIYNVYPESGGIIWGATSSNPAETKAVGMRVENRDKVIFVAPFPNTAGTDDSTDGSGDVATALREIAAAIRSKA
jgi:hypothetical protein